MIKRLLHTSLLISIFLVCDGLAKSAQADEIKIGVRAHRGAEAALKRWQPTADYLSKRIPEHTFTLIPYEINSLLNEAASRKEFDFVLTNPAAHVEQKIRYGATAIATLINMRKNKGYTEFGTVIFARADRTDINSFKDLVDKSFMGADEQGFGGWRVAWLELLKNGINPYKDFKLLSFGGGIQQNVVYSVRDGKIDAGSVRTDMLERMEKQGKIKLKNYKIIGAKTTKGFEFLHSTPLYPEWPFAKLKHTPQDLASKIAAALYDIPNASHAAIKGKYVGWTFPLDYAPVDELLKELRVGPYKVVSQPTLHETFTNHRDLILALFAVFLTAIFISTYILRSNSRLKQIQNSLKTEISERSNANEEREKSERMLQLVLNTIPARVFWKDKNSIYLGCNKLFAKDAGLESPNELIGKSDHDMGWAEQADLYRADDQAVINSKHPKLNYVEPQTTPDGNKIWLETSKIPLTDIEGNIVGMLGTYTDITERKNSQEKLEEYKNRLEEKVAERTAALEASNRELESYSYSIAHDLRAPLRTLIGFSQIIAEDATKKLNEQELDSLERIVSAGKHMANLIDDILELSRITRQELMVQVINISKIAQEVVDELTANTENGTENFIIQDGMTDKGDEILVRILIQNLVDNARKFSRDSSNPTIEIGCKTNEFGNIYYIRDNGIGFDMEYVEKIFIPFRRLHGENYEGTGVGLATVFRIVNRHGGKIWAESNPNEGAIFRFTLNPNQSGFSKS